jgi:transposase-like protein
MARIIWSRPGNPTAAVARALDITPHQLSRALHRVKENARLRPRDNVRIWDDGTVTDERDDWVGNLYDEI